MYCCASSQPIKYCRWTKISNYILFLRDAFYKIIIDARFLLIIARKRFDQESAHSSLQVWIRNGWTLQTSSLNNDRQLLSHIFTSIVLIIFHLVKNNYNLRIHLTIIKNKTRNSLRKISQERNEIISRKIIQLTEQSPEYSKNLFLLICV